MIIQNPINPKINPAIVPTRVIGSKLKTLFKIK